MTDPRAFDEAARQKMAEREFVFQEEHWNDMERLIGQTQRKRRGFIFWFAAAAGLIGLPTLWWLSTDAGNGAPLERTPVPEIVLPITERTVNVTEGSTVLPTTDKAGPITSVAAVPAPQTPSENGSSPRTSALNDRKRAVAATKPNNTPSSIEVTNQTPDLAEEPGRGQPAQAEGYSSGVPTIEVEPVIELAIGTTGTEQPTTNPMQTPAENAAPSPSETSRIPLTAGANEIRSPLPSDTTAAADGAVAQDPPTAPPVIQDSTSIPPLAPDMVRTNQGRWELSTLGGTMFSSSAYSGGGSEEWSTGLTGRWSPTYGIEVVRRNDRVGIGAGVQRTRYAERLQLDRITTQEQAYNSYFTLTPVQVTLLIVTDTITIGAVDYYVTDQIDTVLNQVTRVTDTVQVTRIQREARDQVNVVDYWETSFFADLQSNKGRWSFGVRGGPTLGILSARRGVVPGPDPESFIDLTDKPFRTMMVGFAARGYVRFRVWNELSIGVEPMVRGHFGNAFKSGDLVRKNNAYGVLFSLTYRMP